ncbi:MAG: arginyltransferase [Acidobacteriota bacterium]
MSLLQILQDQPCAYLPDRRAQIRYRLMESCDRTEYQHLLERGWRRFGMTFFRPECSACRACRSLRIDVETFEPTRSMRRTLAKNRDLDLTLCKATLGPQHLDLYQRYHADMQARRGWPIRPMTARTYLHTFLEGRQDFGHELRLSLGDRLLALSMVDVLPAGISAVYTVYDPEHRDRGLGVRAILGAIELARERGLPYVYLGHWIEENVSMSYKSSYRPHELLDHRPEINERPRWSSPTPPGDRG